MRQEPAVQPDRWLALFGLAGSLRSPIEHAAFKVDIPAADSRVKSGPTNRRVASTSVKPDQDKPGDVLADIPLRCLVPKYLFSPPRSPNYPCGIGARKPLALRRRLPRQQHRDDFRASAFPSMMVDCRSPILKFAPGGRFGDKPRRAVRLIGLARFPLLSDAPFHIVAAKLAAN